MDSISLFKKLLEMSEKRLMEFTKNFPRHEKQFSFEKFNELTYQKMYKDLKEVTLRQQFFDDIPDLKEVCKNCWGFYLSPRNSSLKYLDIKLGKEFENLLKEFFATIGLNCVLIDELGLRKNYPDLVFFNKGQEHIAFVEVKYLTAPFVKVYLKVPGRECYEGSTTLDVDIKLEKQRKIVEEEIDVPVFYVYWLDYPCIKGVFFMSAEEVYSYIDETVLEWTRKDRDGDYVSSKGNRVKLGHVDKVYLPLLKMKNFENLVKTLKGLASSS